MLAACGSTRSPQSAVPAAPGPAAPGPAVAGQLPAGVSLLARVTGRRVGIYTGAGSARPLRFLSNPNRYGFRRVFLVKRSAPGWLQVYLPARPNGATGWVRRQDVSVVRDPYRLRVDLRRHRFTLRRAGVLIDSGRIGVGRAVSPTPPGVYFLTELFRVTNPSGPYGPYGFGLSAYSNVFHEFAGGDGQIGIHGTNDPGGIGTDVSHGCIRLPNPQIVRLARLLPLGTPVHIVR